MFGIRQSIFSLEARDVSSKAVQGVFNGNTLKARPLRSLQKLWALQIDNAFIYLFRLKDLKRRPWPRRGEGVGTERSGAEPERSGRCRGFPGALGARAARSEAALHAGGRAWRRRPGRAGVMLARLRGARGTPIRARDPPRPRGPRRHRAAGRGRLEATGSRLTPR